MSLVRSATILWQRAPVWRYGVIGAGVLTVLAIFTGSHPFGGASAPVSQQASTAPSSTSTSATPPSGGLAGCAPQAPTMHAPLVQTQGGGVPSNVTAVGGQAQAPSGGPSAAVQGRYTQFLTRVNAARSEQRAGERCARMAGAVDLLEPMDLAYAHCFPDATDRLTEAQRCEGDLAASEDRFGRLVQAHEAAQADRSAPVLARLAQVRTAMTPFDETRERWRSEADAVAAGAEAQAVMAASDQRLARLEGAAQAAGGGAAGLQALADAGRQIERIDRGRMSARQTAMLEQAVAAAEQLAGSDRRLTALDSAVAAARVGSDGPTRDALIAAVSALTGFDRERATTEQAAALEEARQTAATFALGDLVEAAAGFDPDTSPPEAFVRLQNLRALLLAHGGAEAASPAEAAAMDAANLAAARLAQSDQRLAAVRDTMAAVRRSTPAALSGEVQRTYGAVTDFDRLRMSEADRVAFAELEAARTVAEATETRRLTPATKGAVPIHVVREDGDRLSEHASRHLRETLRSRGYLLVDTPEESAITLRLDRGDVTRRSVQIGSSRVETAELRMGLEGMWTFAGDGLVRTSVEGTASGRDAEAVTTRAVEDAVGRLADALDAFVVD